MPQIVQILLLLSFYLFFSTAIAQTQPVKGKVIPEFGPTYPVENPDFQTTLSEEYKVVFDINKASEDPARINKSIEGVARFLNMHAEAGKSLNTMDVFIVMHGEAAHSLLQDDYYREIYNTGNPNIGILKSLAENEVNIILCGQTANHRNITVERRIPETKIALSAMTALIQLQNDGYKLISF